MKYLTMFTLVYFMAMVPVVGFATEGFSIFKQPQSKKYIAQGRGSSALAKDLNRLQQNSAPTVTDSDWITVRMPKPKDFRKHDLITIVVNETSASSTKSETTTERESGIDMSFDAIMEFSNWRPKVDPRTGATPEIKGTFARDFEGTGEAKRTDTLRVRIQARVVDVLPNGNLVIEAQKTIVTDDDETTVNLSGECKSMDVSVANTIDSTQIANLVVKKTHKGVSKQATKRGFLTKLWDAFSIF